MNSRLMAVSEGELRPILRQPIFSTASVRWAGFQIEEGFSASTRQRQSAVEKPSIFLCNRLQGSVVWSHKGKSRKQVVVPGTVCLCHPRYEAKDVVVSDEWQVLVMALDTTRFREYAPLEARAIESSLVGLLYSEDRHIARLMTEMHQEATAGCPSGRLYAESLSLAVLVYVTAHYTSRTLRQPTKLSPAQQRSVVDIIRGNLNSDMSVSDLAASIDVSATHFARLFKATFGISPHRYVMRERVLRAKTLLANTDWTISYIALDLGFSGHSHFTKVFHALIGVTPSQFREGR